jgi:hypothetical protein
MSLSQQPPLKRIFIENVLPAELEPLNNLSHNWEWIWEN